MPKKDGSSSIKTIEQVRVATLADVQRKTQKLHVDSSKDSQKQPKYSEQSMKL